MEAPYLLLVFLLCAGFVSGQRSRSRILRERLYLETLANKTDVTNVTALNALMTKPLETTTTTTPTPVTEGMDYEGSGYFDLFWKLTARAVTPSTTTLPTTPGSSSTSSTTTPSPRPFTTSSETSFDQYDGYYYDVTSSSTTKRDSQRLPGALLLGRRHCFLLPGGQPFGQPLPSRRHAEPRSALLQRLRFAPLR
jgi:hypothetical protein